MPSQLSEVVQRLRNTFLRQDETGLTDGQLLERFLEQRDQASITALVRRHGPMVWGVCRRILGDPHDADDAFQATFLVLVRKAGSVRQRDLVANWLYGVAQQTALRARVLRAKRRTRERQVAVMPETEAPQLADTWPELQACLDAELSRLPDKYRSAIVLCDLEGRTRKEVARLFGVPEGTLAGRLTRGRALLAKRLARHGFALSGGTLAVVLTRGAASASVPASVMVSAIKAASLFAAGEAAARAGISARVAVLTEGVLKAMQFTKLKAAALVLLLGSLLTLACGVIAAPQATGRENVKAVKKARSQPQGVGRQKPRKRHSGPGTLLLARVGALVVLTPEGKEDQKIATPKDTRLFIFSARLSPDCRRAAYVVTGEMGLRPPARAGEVVPLWPFKVVVGKVGAARPTTVIDLPAHQLYALWTPDGKHLLVTKELGSASPTSFETVRLNPETGRVEPFELPAGVRLLDCSPDGKTLLVIQRRDKKDHLGLVAMTGPKSVREVLTLNGRVQRPVGRFSPDGTKVLYTDADPADKAAMHWGMSSKPYLLDLASKKSQVLADFPTNGQALGVAWSPDGKRVAYTWKQVHHDLLKKKRLNGNDLQTQTEAFLMVADADGRNARTVASGKSDFAINPIFGAVDWR